jgi:hypothetical protein
MTLSEAKKRYWASPKGKAVQRRYLATPEGKESQKRYRESVKGKAMLKKHTKTEAYKESQKRYREKTKMEKPERIENIFEGYKAFLKEAEGAIKSKNKLAYFKCRVEELNGLIGKQQSIERSMRYDRRRYNLTVRRMRKLLGDIDNELTW